MSVTLLQLSMCVATVVQMTSSQPTFNVIHEGNDVRSCQENERMLQQLMTAVSQLLRDVAELKAASPQKDAKGTCLKSRRNPNKVLLSNPIV